MHNLWQKQENRKKKLICSKCGKLKEAEDDCNWRTVNGTPVCFKDGEDPKDSIDKAFSGKDKTDKSSKDRPYTLKDFKDYQVVKDAYKKQTSAYSDIHDAHMKGSFKIDQEELDRTGSRNTDHYMVDVTSSSIRTGADEKEVSEINRRWDYLEKNHGNEPFMAKYNDLKEQTKSFNSDLKSEYDTTPSFFRGSGKDELDSYKESGTIGGDKNKYNYVSVATNPESAGAFGRGVMIEYDGDSIRQHGTLVDYSPRPQQVGTSSSLNPELIGKPMSFRYGNEKEVRLPEGLKLDNVGIKNIHIDSFYNKNRDEISSKYGSLGNIVYHDNYDDWIFSFGDKK